MLKMDQRIVGVQKRNHSKSTGLTDWSVLFVYIEEETKVNRTAYLRDLAKVLGSVW